MTDSIRIQSAFSHAIIALHNLETALSCLQGDARFAAQWERYCQASDIIADANRELPIQAKDYGIEVRT